MRKTTHGLIINLIEECSEVSQMASKCLRFGMMSYNPNDPKKYSNKKLLAKEVGNLLHIIQQCQNNGILSIEDIEEGIQEKFERLAQYPLIVMKNRPDGGF